jgi:hypothetical protein
MHVAKVLPLSDPAPNQGTEPTPYSVRCAPASGRGSCPALDGAKGTERIHESSDDSLVPYSEAYPSVRAIAGKLGLWVSTTWHCLKSPALRRRRAME